jgi:putative glycosyltransferase (TIGR04348 family)
MPRPSVIIVSPALASANNGNWQTAQRWREFLAPACDVRIVLRWTPADAVGETVMLALHARRSAESIEAWFAAHGSGGLAVVLTGTDLYQDIAADAQAQRSLQFADRLVVLQELGAQALPAPMRPKARVIFQSTPAQPAQAKSAEVLQAIAVGHLRAVKSPETLFQAARLLADREDIRIEHVGDGLDQKLADEALATQLACPHYRWLGPLPHEETRERIGRAHALVHPSAMEGGAHVIMEAVCSATPVLASRIPGNVGMLGGDYEGYFEHGDAAALAALLLRCRSGQTVGGGSHSDPLLDRLGAQCRLRAPLFAPDAERNALLRLVADLTDAGP